MADLPYIRAVYIAPWRKGSLAKPGMVARCINVAVRPATTFAGKAMLHPRTDLTTFGATLAGIGWIGKDRGDAHFRRLIGGEVLQLPEGPTMEARPHSQARFDAVADVGQILHRDGPRADAHSLCDDLFAHDVVYVTHVPRFFARDLPQKLLGALRAIGLSSPAQGKMPITFMPESAAAPDFARVDSGKIILPGIDPHHGTGSAEFDLLLKNKIKKPLAFAAVEFSFLGNTPSQKLELVLAGQQRHGDALSQCVERKAVAAHREGALVEMHRGAAEADGWDRLAPIDATVGFERLVGRRYAPERVAAHLCAKRRLSAEALISQRVEFVAVPAARFGDNRHQEIAGTGIGFLKSAERGHGGSIRPDLDRDRAQDRWLFLLLGHLPPLLHMFGTLDILADRLRAHIARRADIVGRGPKVAAPQPLLQLREPDEQLACRGSLQNLDRIGYRDSRRDGHEQVDVIGLDFFGQHRPFLFLTNRIDHFRQSLRHIAGQHVMPVLRAPHHMVSGLVNAIAIVQHFWHNHMVQENCAARNLAFLPRLKPGVSSEEIL